MLPKYPNGIGTETTVPQQPRISIIIPTLNAERYLSTLVETLKSQRLKPIEVIIVDSSSKDNTAALAVKLGCNVHIIDRSTFNHGGTRNMAAKLAIGQILVFMTQDAIPANDEFLDRLVDKIWKNEVSAAYARQIPYRNSSPLEAFARGYNYPGNSSIRTLIDVDRLGIKAYFFSNVASAVSKATFFNVGAFPDDLIINEDMVLAAKLLKAGHKIGYAAEAVVIHSHSYTYWQQFSRYFDMGVFLSRASLNLPGARASGEGLRVVREQIKYLLKEGQLFWIPIGLLDSAFKFGGFYAGRLERFMPLAIKRFCSMHKFFWNKP
jgi:rhamnosyltransferase